MCCWCFQRIRALRRMRERCDADGFLQAALKCVIHARGSQTSRPARLQSGRAIISVNSAPEQGKKPKNIPEAPDSVLTNAQQIQDHLQSMFCT